jgi:mannose/fructose/N-acetylgalactosamine-specific phosphotransferase system component IID
MPTACPDRARLRRAILLAAARSLFLESSWNTDGQQNLGRAWTEGPALEALDAAEGLPPSLLLEPFNTNPLACGLVLGASMALEWDASEGAGRSPAERKDIVASLASVAGAVGDQLFWNTWLPFCSLCAFLAVWLTGSWAAAFLLPALFTAAAAPARVLAFFRGFSKGKGAVADASVARLLIMRRKLHSFALFLAGALTVLALAAPPSSGWIPEARSWQFVALFLIASASMSFAARRRPGLKGPLYAAFLASVYVFFLLAAAPLG